eukprot:2794713-Lingulodinium_polyedra.AAC.1
MHALLLLRQCCTYAPPVLVNAAFALHECRTHALHALQLCFTHCPMNAALALNSCSYNAPRMLHQMLGR